MTSFKAIGNYLMLLLVSSILGRNVATAWQSPLSRRVFHRSLPFALSASTESSTTDATEVKSAKKPVPITLLSGFLGTGKTTTLKHLLENVDGVKIGVIVNDVASVNIDAKLVAGQTIDGMVELQNGCACCSLADELFFSVDTMINDRELDAIVVELSGVADPMAIKNNWIMAPSFVKEKADVTRVVTVIDAASFGTDYMSWDEARERKGWLNPNEEMSPEGNRKVSELLAEQVEAADIILLNKIDLAENEEQIAVAEKVARALNDKAEVRRVQFGVISPSLVLSDGAENKVAHDCSEPDCTDSSHSHSHDHSCAEPDCTDSSHSHSHDHSCAEPGCTDTSHSHSHAHDAEACNDPACTEDHSHSHSHTSVDELGIVNFVYKSTRPFDPVRLMNVLNKWPVPVKETLDLNILSEGYEIPGEESDADSPFVGVLRSKGFCWFAPNKWTGANEDAWRHDTAMFWSHAGKSFTLSSAGKWWGTLDKETMKKYFVSNMKEFDRIIAEDFQTEEFGDRRQEIVFIGVNLDEEKIRKTMDECLLSDDDMEKYRRNLRNYESTLFSK
jgi:G3E family GTPase